MKEPKYYRARIKLIQRLMQKELQDAGEKSPVYRALQNGFIPDKYASEVASLETLQEQEPNYALSPLEVATLDTYFAIYPEKVAGTTRVGSGFMRATEVIGTRADIDNVFSFLTTKKMENQSGGLKAGQTVWVRLDGKVRQATVMNDFMGGLTTNDEVPLSIDLGGARSRRSWKVKNIMLEKPAESKYTTGQWVMFYKETRANGATTSRKVYGQITRMSPNASGEYTYQMDEPKAVVTDYVNPSQDIRQRQFILDENASYDFTDSDEVDVLSKSDIDDFVRDFRLRAQSSDDYGYSVVGPQEMLGPTKESAPTSAPQPKPETAIVGIGAIDKVALAAAITRSKEKSDKGSDNPNAAPLLSFDEVIDLYNPGISEFEIKAWVWYKQSFGVPMTGWEKYFITSKTKGTGENLVHAKETVDLLDNFFRKVRTVPPGTVIGKRTKFKNEYDKENYLVVRTEQNELLYVAESKVTEKKAEYLVDETALEKLIKEKALIYFDGSLLPIPVYTFGNMYEREKQLEKDRAYIVEMYGESHYEFAKQLIEENKPTQLRVESPDKSMRPKILALSLMSNDPTIFSIKELSEESGISLPNPKNKRMSKDDPENRYTLREAYEIWLDTIKDTDIPNSSKDYIRDYYLSQKRFPEEMPDSKRTEIQANARLAAETLFSEFLASGLLYEDQLKINRIWNETYNSFSQVNKYRVPVGFTCSRTFKNSLLSIRPVQREGVAFMNIVGSGCLAYDVGVGKTMTAIIILAMKIQSGECSRALLAVPKPTYQKWKRELFGYYTDGQKKSDTSFDGATYVTGILSYTGIKLNDWQNLGTAVVEKLGNKLEETLPEKSITMVTFEGLAKIGFSKKVFESIFDDLVDILYNGGNEESYRQKQIEYSKYREMMGKGIKGTVTDIDVIGIDYLVVDEAHNFKNVFETVGRDKEQKRNLFGLKGAQSDRAVKLFFLSQYIQRQYGKKVCLLTATPFTNSPLEIFSMLSFIGYETLRDYNLQNIRRFFELFVLESFEYTVSLRDTIDVKPVIKSFNNRLVLQKLLYNHFDYKTGADAGIVRPCKINFPLIKIQTPEGAKELPPEKQVTTYLDMTEAQMVNQRDVVETARTAGYDNPGQMFRALARSLDNAFSPFLFESTIPDDDLTPEEFVLNSPKIHYTIECIRSVKEYHESRKEQVSGQVIYSNRGKEYFRLIKAYLEMSVGYQKRVAYGATRLDEVEILDSEVSEKKKDDIKEAFLSGVVKIIIGTATIKEGIDLQTRGTVLYNLYPDWNPTDMQQLEGRIYRQGNQFGYVRIVQPLVVNSMDVFVFQKLEEKTARLNTIWSRQGKTNVLDMDALDVEEIKYALIDNPLELSNMRIGKELANLNKELSVAEENLKMYGSLRNLIFSYNTYRKQVIDYANSFYENTKRNRDISKNKIDDPATDKELVKKYKTYLEKFEKMIARMEAFFNAIPQSDRELLDIMRSIRSTDWGFTLNSYPEYSVNNFRNYFSQVAKAERQILKAYDLTIESDLAPLKEKLEDIIRGVKERIEYVSSADYSQVVYQQVQAELEKRRAVRGTVEQQVAKFKRTNIVLSYPADNVDRNNCIIPDVECCAYNPSEAKEPEYYNGENEATPVTEEVGTVAEPVMLTPEQELQEISEAIEVLQLLLEDSESESEKIEIKEAIEVLELLLEDMQVAA